MPSRMRSSISAAQISAASALARRGERGDHGLRRLPSLYSFSLTPMVPAVVIEMLTAPCPRQLGAAIAHRRPHIRVKPAVSEAGAIGLLLIIGSPALRAIRDRVSSPPTLRPAAALASVAGHRLAGSGCAHCSAAMRNCLIYFAVARERAAVRGGAEDPRIILPAAAVLLELMGVAAQRVCLAQIADDPAVRGLSMTGRVSWAASLNRSSAVRRLSLGSRNGAGFATRSPTSCSSPQRLPSRARPGRQRRRGRRGRRRQRRASCCRQESAGAARRPAARRRSRPGRGGSSGRPAAR